MVKKLYALSLSARTKTRVEIWAGWCIASSEEEAVGVGIKMAKTNKPISEGYAEHQCNAFAIDETVYELR